MSYLDRLTDLETHQRPTDRTDKSTSGGFVSSLPARIERAAPIFEPADPGRPPNEPLPDPAMEARRQDALADLRRNPNFCPAAKVHQDCDPVAVIVTVGVRNLETGELATGELRIPRERFDAFRFFELFESLAATRH